MDVLRQETDYALRLIAALGGQEGKSVPTRQLAKQADVSYEFACKILQKLHDAKFVVSVMGPKGGYRIGKNVKDVSLLDVINVMQGPLSIRDCLLGENGCCRKECCTISGKLKELQDYVETFLKKISLEEVLKNNTAI